jgi:hypothetical protein
MRWKDKDDWVRSDRPTHEPLVTEDVFKAATNRLSSGASPRTRMPKGTTNRYSLRGMLSCGICGRTMQGAFRESRRKDGTGRVLYKCEPHKHRALPRRDAASVIGVCPGGRDPWAAQRMDR